MKRTTIFPLRYLSMRSSDLVPNRICYRISRRMDQHKPKGHLSSAEAPLLDGAAIVNMLKSRASKTFQEYSETIFLPYLINQLRSAKRADVVWARYLPGSLKDSARSKRGMCIRRRVRADTRIPGDWTAFLRFDKNKPGRAAYHN